MAELSSSVVGFDIGSENCYIAVARQGGIEVILNDYSQRTTPAYVLLGGKQREIGVSAKQKHSMNLNNTFYALSRLVGRQYNEVIHHEKVPFPIEQAPNGEIAVRVIINNEEWIFTVTQLLAMLFTKLRHVSNMPIDCVINCPHYFTDGQRRALKDAAVISGLNPLRILPDITAIAINYSFYRLINAKEENNIVVFIDCGHTNIQCGIVLFNTKQNQMYVLSVEYEKNLGGKHFNEAIAENFINQKKLNLNRRSHLRFVAECEKIKKQMSANSNELPLNVECLQDDRDFSGRMSRKDFEEMIQNDLHAIESLLKRALSNAMETYSNLQKNNKELNLNSKFNLNDVEIVGGTSRIPAIKKIIHSVFGMEASTTLNADEAVSRGAALQCALLSPSFKVSRQLSIYDYAPYQINCRYFHASEAEGKTYSISPLFSRGSTVPFTRQIIITCHSLPIVVEFEYINSEMKPVSIGQFKIVSFDKIQINSNKMKIRIRLDNNGLVKITSAAIQVDEKANDATEPTNDGEDNSPMETDENGTKEGNGEPGEKEASNDKKASKPKSKVSSIEMIVQEEWIRGKLTDDLLQQYKEIEANLVLADKHMKEKLDARNALEEYIYDWRDKLDGQQYDMFITPQDKQTFHGDLGKTEEWLYADEESGDIQSRAVYQEKMDNLKKRFSNDLVFRSKEHETRAEVIERLGKSIQMGYKLLENKEIEEAKLKSLHELLTEQSKWFEKAHGEFSSMCLTTNPRITTKEIQEHINATESTTKSIMEDLHRKRAEEERKKKEEKDRIEKQAKEQKAKEQNEVASEDKMDVDPQQVEATN